MAVPLNTNQCDIDITDECAERNDHELVMEHGQVLGYWNGCSRCLEWLSAMARVEREPDSDPERKAKHVREVAHRYGSATRDLTPFMRPNGTPGKPDLKAV
ncbi:hypothetical protein [Mycobacterium asiaticum]|uniref:hypothetical protein n=1 Tax=Mycobacterium asiaticum TaxID=1790 RepID=UPI0012DB53DE|nr:hypothetical protein [Mycobacterium asiaticum]